jgi:ABC-type multidrug transport system ATPase subunit
VTDLPFPLSGCTLVVGPSGAGKTTPTARALEAWLAHHGPDGTVVFDFAPEIERNGRTIGARLDRYTTLPEAI